jgi:hypothetical protein
LWDAPRLRRAHLPPKPLDLECVVLEEGSPVSRAVRASVQPGQRLVTLVLPAATGHGFAGYVQARRRTDPAEADITWLAPDAAEGAALGWSRLLGAVTQVLGAAGTQRVFVALPADDAVAAQVFRQLGFTEYAADAVYRRVGPCPAAVAQSRVVDESPALALRIHQTLLNQLPSVARTAQGADDWATYPAGGWTPGGERRRVWLDGRGEVLGAWRIVPGRGGLWLRLVLGSGVDAGRLVGLATADAQLRYGPDRPLYASVRTHEGALGVELEALGFELVARRRRLVKHTTVRVLAPRWQRRAVSEAAREPAANHGAPAQDTVHRAGVARPRSQL